MHCQNFCFRNRLQGLPEDVYKRQVDKAAAMKQFREDKVNVKDTYAESETQYRKQMWSSIFSTLVMSGVILIISFIEIYLIIRASFLSRVKEVGVYSCLLYTSRCV